MTFVTNTRLWSWSERLASRGGQYFIAVLLGTVLITSLALLVGTRTSRLHIKSDPEIEAHLAECQGCRNRAVSLIWNHIPENQDRSAFIQSHLDHCAQCQREVLAAVHDHTQLVSPLRAKSRVSVPMPSQPK